MSEDSLQIVSGSRKISITTLVELAHGPITQQRVLLVVQTQTRVCIYHILSSISKLSTPVPRLWRSAM
jgi:hypothetical protein